MLQYTYLRFDAAKILEIYDIYKYQMCFSEDFGVC